MSVDRREFIKSVLAAIPMTVFDWDAFPRAGRSLKSGAGYDAIIIGCRAGRLELRPPLSPARDSRRSSSSNIQLPGGYATTFKRPGGFVFDVSLHSTSVGERNGLANLISGFPEITDVEFVSAPDSVSGRSFPDDDIRVPHKDISGLHQDAHGHFPAEKEGIDGIFNDMKGLTDDLNKIFAGQGQDQFRARSPRTSPSFPELSARPGGPWSMPGRRIRNSRASSRLSGAISAFRPPSCRAFIMRCRTTAISTEGGYYPIGKSQKISDAFVRFIEGPGRRSPAQDPRRENPDRRTMRPTACGPPTEPEYHGQGRGFERKRLRHGSCHAGRGRVPQGLSGADGQIHAKLSVVPGLPGFEKRPGRRTGS